MLRPNLGNSVLDDVHKIHLQQLPESHPSKWSEGSAASCPRRALTSGLSPAMVSMVSGSRWRARVRHTGAGTVSTFSAYLYVLVFTILLELSLKDGSIWLGSIAGMRKQDRLLTGCLRSFPMASQCVSGRSVAWVSLKACDWRFGHWGGSTERWSELLRDWASMRP